MRVRRTLMYINGYMREKLLQALESNVDCIVFELEDLCPATMKDAAREGTVEALKTLDFGTKERIVRINDPTTEIGRKDMEAIFPLAPDAIRLPKCETVEYILDVDRRLTETEKALGLPKNTIELIIIIETPRGVRNVYELAGCCERITGLTLGAGDLTSAMGIERDLTPDSVQLLYAKQKLIMAAKDAGIQVHDTCVTAAPGQDLDDFIKQDTEKDKLMGFTGRSVTTFSHIDIINGVFAPSEEEYETAKKIIVGYSKALADGEEGDIWIEGHFVDPPVITKAEATVEYYEAVQKKESKK